ncbi:hypothetical protein PR202_gb13568 [Eleusine coracana subsp. coracana]|uniref:Secreted protein n=1 Tax=Eleusine coracana subsp. coracana TaxID=191504 RepID=A0AAV5EU20_ELECO|nr:hypothetical protein PR202_gb13568 [Eleusine coracana subsp. coracana]
MLPMSSGVLLMLVASGVGSAVSAGPLEAGFGLAACRFPASWPDPVGGARPTLLMLLLLCCGSPLQSTTVEAFWCQRFSPLLVSGFDGGLEDRGGVHDGRGGVEVSVALVELGCTLVLEGLVVFFLLCEGLVC